MRWFFRRNRVSDLERELVEGRPQPRHELVEKLVARVEDAPLSPAGRRQPDAQGGRSRTALALVFGTVVVLLLAAFGGIGYAKSSMVAAAKGTGDAVAAIAKGNEVSSPSRVRMQASSQAGSPTAKHAVKRKAGNKHPGTSAGKSAKRHKTRGKAPGAKSSKVVPDSYFRSSHSPWVWQYSRLVLVCYPFKLYRRWSTIIVYRTIIVPRTMLRYFVPPGRLGICKRPHSR